MNKLFSHLGSHPLLASGSHYPWPLCQPDWQGYPGLPPEVVHSYRAYSAREGQWCCCERSHSSFQGVYAYMCVCVCVCAWSMICMTESCMPDMM